MADRYFIDDEPALAAKLDAFLGKLKASMDAAPFREKVFLLLLAGGYGRGEGGVYRGEEVQGPTLYNDLEFFVFTGMSGIPPGLNEWCHKWSEEGHAEIGIEVEFKVQSFSTVLGVAPTMFLHDLVMGHKVICGDPIVSDQFPQQLYDAAQIPSTEATRLLFNRGSGLLFSRELLAKEEVDSPFIERNHAKVRLALADAVLALNGRYDWSCRSRHARLEETLPQVPADWTQIKEWHRQGVEFKLHPRHEFPGTMELRKRQEELTWVWLRTFLWMESVRLKRVFPDRLAYPRDTWRLFPESSRLKNLALRVRDHLRIKSHLPQLLDYPRAPLQRALVLLLASPENDSAAWSEGATLLGLSPKASPGEVMKAYRLWWGRYN